MIKVLYLTCESLETDPIITSQVLKLINALNSKYSIQLVTVEDKKFINQNSHLKSHTFIQRKNPVLSIFKLTIWFFFNFNKYDIIHVRSYLPMFAVILPKLFFSKPVIFDMRGLMPYEFRLRAKTHSKFHKKIYYNFAFLLFYIFEYIFIQISTAIVVVSNPFSKYVKGKLLFKTPVFEIPTFTSFKNDVQAQKNTSFYPLFPELDATIFIYSGSLDIWQQFSNTIILFQAILEKIPDSKLLVLTRQIELANKLLSTKLPKNSYRVLSVLPNQVADILTLGDFGILLREPDPVNTVSAPIKFAEYLSAGLRIIISNGIGDASAQVSNNGLGFVIHGLDKQSFSTFVSTHIVELKIKSSLCFPEQAKSLLSSKYSLEQAALNYGYLYKQLILE